MTIIPRELASQQGLIRFFTGVVCCNGHLSDRYTLTGKCVKCVSDYKKKHYEQNKEHINSRKNKYRSENKGVVSQINRTYYNNNKNKIIERHKINNRNNPLPRFIRSVLHRVLGQNKQIGAFNKCEQIVGYNVVELKEHLESLFVEGMSWDNYGAWHIDHIKPIIVFQREGVVDPQVINALDNLQPLWAVDNHSKGCKYEL